MRLFDSSVSIGSTVIEVAPSEAAPFNAISLLNSLPTLSVGISLKATGTPLSVNQCQLGEGPPVTTTV